MVFSLFGRKRKETAVDVDALISDMRARTGVDTRPDEIAAWALLFRSPFKTYDTPTSWLGGVPSAPENFRWPSGNDGLPLTFVAQIDLSALQSDTAAALCAPGLPQDGALLAFIGDGFAIRVLTPEDVANGKPVIPPADTPDVDSLGFWGEGQGFTGWAVDPVPFMSRGEEHPTFMPTPFERPRQWITTWGIAALEARIVVEALDRELKLHNDFIDTRKQIMSRGGELPTPPHVEKRLAHIEIMNQLGPTLRTALADWFNLANAMDPEAAPDQTAVDAIFSKRKVFARKLEQNYGTTTLLPGDAKSVWDAVLSDLPRLETHHDFSRVPAALQPLVETMVTGWRGHRLFGLEPEFSNNFEDLRGQDPIISIASDELLGTQSEHDYGFSVWLDRMTMTQGIHENGQLIHHCAV